MDSALNGPSLNGNVTCQDYLKGIHTLKGNSYSYGTQFKYKPGSCGFGVYIRTSDFKFPS